MTTTYITEYSPTNLVNHRLHVCSDAASLNPVWTAAVDLALVSQCNHSITSHGTFSFWAGLLAGRGRGQRVIPPFFSR